VHGLWSFDHLNPTAETQQQKSRQGRAASRSTAEDHLPDPSHDQDCETAASELDDRRDDAKRPPKLSAILGAMADGQ